jgi:6-phosphogluconate dehydrogenase
MAAIRTIRIPSGALKSLQEKGLNFVDVGTSGGIWGLIEGYSMMIGGDAKVTERHRDNF